MLVKNPDAKRLADECKEAYTVHLYKYATSTVGGCGVDVTKKKLRLHQILKWEPFPPGSFNTYMDAHTVMPKVLKMYLDAFVTMDDNKSEDT